MKVSFSLKKKNFGRLKKLAKTNKKTVNELTKSVMLEWIAIAEEKEEEEEPEEEEEKEEEEEDEDEEEEDEE